MAIFQPKMAQKWPLMAKIPKFFYESCEAIKMVPYGEFSSILLLSSQKNYVLCPSENIENCLNLFCHYFSNYGNYFSKLAEGMISILFAFYYWDLNAFKPLSQTLSTFLGYVPMQCGVCIQMYKVLDGCTRFNMVVQGHTCFYNVLHDCTRLKIVVKSCTRLYMIVKGCTWLSKLVYNCSRLYMVNQ